ncbi:hypothetical protein RhiirA4_471479 [Rhizophagus irregularis]|uniref:Uncharacterized protein n=1 Tax=Rhizophagus irregularis TaxID=588596 RepID=A0A2I1H377_9GLOM|nr:hypothetical protein RhiirA4_471479 [Rhizophagus irregularis]
MIIPYILTRAINHRHYKAEVLTRIKNDCLLSSQVQVPGIIVNCWVKMAKVCKYVFKTPYVVNTDYNDYTILRKILERAIVALLKVFGTDEQNPRAIPTMYENQKEQKKRVSLFQRCENVEEEANLEEGGMTTACSLIAIHIEESQGKQHVVKICIDLKGEPHGVIDGQEIPRCQEVISLKKPSLCLLNTRLQVRRKEEKVEEKSLNKFLVMNMTSMPKTEHNVSSWSLAIRTIKIKTKEYDSDDQQLKGEKSWYELYNNYPSQEYGPKGNNKCFVE